MSDKAPAKPAKPAEPTSITILDRVLSYADKPWEAIIILLAIIICGLGWIIWTERARIADYVLNDVAARAALREDTFTADAARLLRDTRGDLALLIELKLGDNLMIDRVGIDRDGNRWIPSTGPQAALLPDSSMPFLVHFLANETVCLDTAAGKSEDIAALAAKGYQRMCMVSIPPILGATLGALVVAWRGPLPPVSEGRIGLVMRSAALSYATW